MIPNRKTVQGKETTRPALLSLSVVDDDHGNQGGEAATKNSRAYQQTLGYFGENLQRAVDSGGHGGSGMRNSAVYSTSVYPLVARARVVTLPQVSIRPLLAVFDELSMPESATASGLPGCLVPSLTPSRMSQIHLVLGVSLKERSNIDPMGSENHAVTVSLRTTTWRPAHIPRGKPP